MTPTQLTLRHLRDEGWTADIVERRVTSTLTHDLYGCIDVLAVRGTDVLAVQATTSSNVAARVKKIADNPNLAAIRRVGWALEVWGWRKKGTTDVVRRVDCS